MLVFFRTFTLAFLAANTPTSTAQDSTIDQSSGLIVSPDTLRREIVDPANPALSVPEGGFSAKGDLFSVMSQSLTFFNEYPNSVSPSPAPPEDKRSGVIIHHDDKSSEEHSTVRLQMDLERPQTSITSQDHTVPPNFRFPLPGNDLSITNLSKTNTGRMPNASHNQTDGRIQVGLNIFQGSDKEEEGRTARYKQDHNSFFFDFRVSTSSLPYSSEKPNPDMPSEGSGSGSGLHTNRLNQELDEVTTVKTDLSTISNPATNSYVDKTGKKSKSARIKLARDTDPAGSKISMKKECETAAERAIVENESDLSGEEEKNAVHH